jgi:hypothetical protein
MKTKPLYKPKDILPHFKEILHVLLPGPANVNYIFRYMKQTGLPGSGYKRKILEAITYLEDTDFIADVSGYKGDRRGKKQIKQLTVLGRELAELLDSIDRYYTSYSELSKKFHSELNYTRRSDILDSIMALLSLSPVEIFSIIILRYVLIMSYADINREKNTDIKKDILNRIVVKSISEHLSLSVDVFKDMPGIDTKFMTNKAWTESFIKKNILGEFEIIVKTIADEVLPNNMDVLLSILSMSKPSIEVIDDQIDQCKSFLNLRAIQAKIPESEIKYKERLLMLFEQYKMRRSLSSPSSTTIT